MENQTNLSSSAVCNYPMSFILSERINASAILINTEFNCSGVLSHTYKPFQQTGMMAFDGLFKYERYNRWFGDVSALINQLRCI